MKNLKSIKILGLFALIGLMALSNPSFAGGPWPKGKGKTYLKIGEWGVVSARHFTDNGGIDPNVTTGIFNTFLYGEYGLSDRLTATLYFPFFSRTYMNNLVSATTGEVIVAGDALNSIGDTDLGVKYTLTKPGAKIPVSASLILGLPFGRTAGGEQMNLQTGDGEFNQILRIDAARSFKLGKQNSYVSIYSGFNNRTNGFSDEFRYGAEWGVNLLKQRLWLIGRIDGAESFRNGSKSNEDITSTTIFGNNAEFTNASIEAAFYVNKKIGFSAMVANVLRGSIIFAAPSYSVGIFADL